MDRNMQLKKKLLYTLNSDHRQLMNCSDFSTFIKKGIRKLIKSVCSYTIRDIKFLLSNYSNAYLPEHIGPPGYLTPSMHQDFSPQSISRRF